MFTGQMRRFGRWGEAGDPDELIKQLNQAAFAHTYQETDRILSRQQVVCQFEALGPDIPGMSAGTEIWFNSAHSDLLETEDGLISFAGLNYHELSHVMFTPPVGTWLRDQVIASGLAETFNILEDQRIESLMVAKYRSIAVYFVSMFVQHCLSHDGAETSAYALAAGRRYLPVKLRDALRETFELQSDLPELERLIGEYRRMAFRRDGQETMRRAFLIIKRVHEILTKLNEQPEAGHGHGKERDNKEREFIVQIQRTETQHGENSQQNRSEDDKDRNDNQQEAQKSLANLDANNDEDSYDQHEEPEEDEGEGAGDGEDGDGEDGDGDSDSVGGTRGSGDIDSKDKNSKGGGKGKGETENDGEGGNGSSSGSGTNPDPDEAINQARQIAQSIADSVKRDKGLLNDIREKQEIAKKSFGRVALPPTRRYKEDDVDPKYLAITKNFEQELQRIWVDTDPGWQRHVADGRINIMRAMDQDHFDFDSMFDRWNAGQNDATDIELVLLEDQSSSMSRVMADVSQAAWAIKKAVDAIGGKTTVFAYSEDVDTVYQSNESAKPVEYKYCPSGGGTDPIHALMSAGFLLEKSTATLKLLITLTDGEWAGDNDAQHELIQQMRQQGVITALGFYDTSYGGTDPDEEIDAHFHASATFLRDGADFAELARSVVTQSMQTVAAHP